MSDTRWALTTGLVCFAALLGAFGATVKIASQSRGPGPLVMVRIINGPQPPTEVHAVSSEQGGPVSVTVYDDEPMSMPPVTVTHVPASVNAATGGNQSSRLDLVPMDEQEASK